MCGTLKQPKTVDDAVQYAIAFALDNGWAQYNITDIGRPEVVKHVRRTATALLRDGAWMRGTVSADALAQLARTPDAELTTRYTWFDIIE